MSEQDCVNSFDIGKIEEIADSLLKASDHWQRAALRSLTLTDKWRARDKARETGVAGVMLQIEAKLELSSRLKAGRKTPSKSSRTTRGTNASKTSQS